MPPPLGRLTRQTSSPVSLETACRPLVHAARISLDPKVISVVYQRREFVVTVPGSFRAD